MSSLTKETALVEHVFTIPFLVPPEELESPAFCSASKRSIQLSYEGLLCL